MSLPSVKCFAYQTRTGDYECNRCGYQWDADDTAPVCKTNDELLHNWSRKLINEFKKSNKLTGLKALNKMKEELAK